MNKVKQIIREEFDPRLDVMVLTYTLAQLGMMGAARITDENIAKLKGNGLMTDEFVKSMARTARRIGTECDFIEDVIPYILKEMKHLGK